MKKVILLLALLVALGCMPAAMAEEDWIRTPGEIAAWDREVDFLIVGYGLAGASAAVEAHDIDPEADILVLEKMSRELAGGNSIASGQTFLVPSQEGVDELNTYLTQCNEPNDIPGEYMEWLCQGFADQLPWIEAVADSVGYEVGYVGGGELQWDKLVVEFDTFEGSSFEGCSAHLRTVGGTFEKGGVWRCFDKAVELRDIEVLYSTPAVALVQDPVTKEVLGAVARNADGQEIAIKSAKGVLLACGGYENNLEMQRDFNGMDTVYTSGTPGNTGDGIKMLMEAGAKIWHMSNQTESAGVWLGIKVPEYETTFIRNFTMAGKSWIEIAADGNRFYNESASYHMQHMKYQEFGRYVDLPHARAMPVDLIFDDTTRAAGPIVTHRMGWPTTIEGYAWSADNLAEIEKGWIIQADTIEELAVKMGRDPEALRATIDRWNAACDAGVDNEFGRDPATMAKIETAPYHAVSITPTLVATTGGAKRDTAGRVLDWNENPIPGLYEAGQLGSYVSNLYQNGVYLSEAMLSGRTAAQTAFGGESYFEVVENTASGPAWAEEADGVYTGTAESLHSAIQVAFTVENGKLTQIEVLGGELFITPDQLTQFTAAIVAAQSLGVDMITGATADCQAIGAALGNAFAQ